MCAACRQPDGPIPTPNSEDAGRLVDLGRDLHAVSLGQEDAPKDFVDDFVVFVDEHLPEAVSEARSFAQSLSDALVQKPFSQDAADRLARTTWTVVGATELSSRQVKAV
jgi:hypothetical protein